MLKSEHNELLTRVGAGTPMGELMRRYWIPAIPSADLRRDARPTVIRLLGEDLVAFRDSEGSVGVTSSRCPHRGAPLTYGRNEDCGLRCVYHGWKFDVTGTCVEMPNEPPDTQLKAKVRLPSYPCRERNGVVWVYMGPDTPPELPHLEWNLVPEENVFLSLRVQDCNWLQALEGEVDSSHAPILHSRLDSRRKSTAWHSSLAPKFELVDTEYGAMIAARREAEGQKHYWRINQFIFPFYTLVPPAQPSPDLSGHAWVPIDDYTTLAVMFSYLPNEPLSDKKRRIYEEGYQGREVGHLSRNGRPGTQEAGLVPYSAYRPFLSATNDFGFDEGLQRETFFSGLPGLWVQDAACQSGVEPLLDRTQEHLGSSDAGIIRTRMLLRRAAENLRDHGTPPPAVEPSTSHVRAVSLMLDADKSWTDAAAKHVYGRGPIEYEIV